MEPGELKPLLATLALPPAALLLPALLGWVLLVRGCRRLGAWLCGLALALLWLASCHGAALLMARALLPLPSPADPAALSRAQAIVVLGGGVERDAPEYGAPQPSSGTLARIRYGARLARSTGLPLAFAGGVGWASAGMGAPSEAEVAEHTLAQDFGLHWRWREGRSRDTAENAREMRRLLSAQGFERIALVTDALHMARAAQAFRHAGFDVLPAPTGFPSQRYRPLLEWLPSGEGLGLTRQVWREWLALQVAGQAPTP